MVKGCLGTDRNLPRAFLRGTWRGKQRHPEDWALGKNMGTVTHCALGGHTGTAAACASLGKGVTVWNYIHTNVKIASHVFNY